jgi:hypothetical protein
MYVTIFAMDFKVVLGIIAALLAAGSAYLYIRDIFRGNTKPHIYTWLIWAIVTVIGFLGQWVSGGGAGSWATGVTAIYTVVVFLLALRYGTTDITTFDKVCLALALISIAPWLLTRNILWSVILATFTDVVGFLPTIRKTWNASRSESLGSMYFDATKHALSIVSLQTYSLTTWLYPAGVLAAKIIIIVEIIFLRSTRKTLE